MSSPSVRPHPHLQIYRRSYAMVLSILHRATGLALSVGLLLLAAWLLALASGPGPYQRATALLDSWLGLIVLAGFAASYCYHFVTGIRHLIFDTGHCLERREARRSAVVVIVATFVLALLVLWMALRLKGFA